MQPQTTSDVWDWDFFWEAFPDIVTNGLLVTVQVTVLGSLVAYVLGLVLALLRRSAVRVVSTITWLLIEFIRSTPLLVQVFVVFTVFPTFGVTLEPITTGVIVFGVHYATYSAEVYRAGIDAVPKGQWEAATALSLPRARTWTGVILPQAFPRVLPALGNYTISMLKETPLLLTIGVLDVVGVADEFGSENFRWVEPMSIAGILFLVVSYSASLLVRWLERRVGIATR